LLYSIEKLLTAQKAPARLILPFCRDAAGRFKQGFVMSSGRITGEKKEKTY